MKIEKVTLTRISRTPKTSRDGKPYVSVGIVTKEYGDKKWLNGFENKENKNWKEGDVVEVIIEVKGEYTNFVMPNVEAKAEMVKQETEVRLRSMWNDIQNLTKRIVVLEKDNGIDPQASAFQGKTPAHLANAQNRDPQAIDDAFARHVADENDYGNP